MMPSTDRKALVLQAARAVPSPVRSAVRRRNATMAVAAIAAAGVAFALAGGVRITGRPAPLFVGTSIGLAVLALGGAWLGLSRGRSMLGRPRLFLVALVSVLPAAMLAWKVGYTSLFEGWSHEWLPRTGFKCLGVALAVAVVPLSLALVARRRSDPVHPTATGAAVGTAIGGCTGVLVDLWCPVAYLPHLLLGHVLPILLLAATGALLGRRALGLGR